MCCLFLWFCCVVACVDNNDALLYEQRVDGAGTSYSFLSVCFWRVRGCSGVEWLGFILFLLSPFGDRYYSGS